MTRPWPRFTTTTALVSWTPSPLPPEHTATTRGAASARQLHGGEPGSAEGAADHYGVAFGGTASLGHPRGGAVGDR